jgi:hypothetical protein
MRPLAANEICGLKVDRPHVVILGAGASKAAFPAGDANGLRLPLLNELVETVGLDHVLERSGVRWRGVNFEELYSDLEESGRFGPLLNELEAYLELYFRKLRLPERATIYDQLVASLRAKDVIATFNWDPLLQQAFARARGTNRELPRLICLHGGIGVGYCDGHKPIKVGRLGSLCECKKPLKPTKLLYPVRKKDYSSDAHLQAAWHDVRLALHHAYFVTIFGYSAPVSDAEAVGLLLQGWGPREKRRLEQIEIIDLKPEAELMKAWDSFICNGHAHVCRQFSESQLARFPRRSCDAFWSATMDLDPKAETPIPDETDLQLLQDWFTPFRELEQRREEP